MYLECHYKYEWIIYKYMILNYYVYYIISQCMSYKKNYKYILIFKSDPTNVLFKHKFIYNIWFGIV